MIVMLKASLYHFTRKLFLLSNIWFLKDFYCAKRPGQNNNNVSKNYKTIKNLTKEILYFITLYPAINIELLIPPTGFFTQF